MHTALQSCWGLGSSFLFVLGLSASWLFGISALVKSSHDLLPGVPGYIEHRAARGRTVLPGKGLGGLQAVLQKQELHGLGVRVRFHTHPPKRLAHPRSPIPSLSTPTSRATHAHPTSLHSTGFCAIWMY